jgi:hypothetical protein
MLPTSDAYQAAVQTSHVTTAKVNVIQNGKVVDELPIFDGEVTADATAANRRQCTISIADPTGKYTPEDAKSQLTPFGTQLQAFLGVRIPGVQLVEDYDNSPATWGQRTNQGMTVDPVTGNLVLAYGVS